MDSHNSLLSKLNDIPWLQFELKDNTLRVLNTAALSDAQKGKLPTTVSRWAGREIQVIFDHPAREQVQTSVTAQNQEQTHVATPDAYQTSRTAAMEVAADFSFKCKIDGMPSGEITCVISSIDSYLNKVTPQDWTPAVELFTFVLNKPLPQWVENQQFPNIAEAVINGTKKRGTPVVWANERYRAAREYCQYKINQSLAIGRSSFGDNP